MHIYTKLSLLASTLALSSCQTTALSGLKDQTHSILGCLTYQQCNLSGTLKIQGSGNYAAYSVLTLDNQCFPLLTNRRHQRAYSKFNNKPVKVSGLSLVRLSDGDAETLSVQYFDRSLPAYSECKGQSNVIYVQKISSP